MGFMDIFKGLAGAIPVAGPAISAGLGLLQGRNENNANLAGQQAFNDYLSGIQGFDEDTKARIAASGFDPYAARTNTGTSSGTSDQVQNVNMLNQQRVVNSPQTQALINEIVSQNAANLNRPTVLPEGTLSRMAAAVNNTSGRAEQAAREAAGLKGMGAAQTYGASSGASQARAAQIADLMAQWVPGGPQEQALRAQFRNEALGTAQSQAGQDTRQTGTTRTRGTTSGTTSSTGPASFADIMAYEGLGRPQAPMAPMQTGQNPWLNAGQDLVGGLSQWYANKNRPIQYNNPMTMPGSYPGSAIDPNVINRSG